MRNILLLFVILLLASVPVKAQVPINLGAKNNSIQVLGGLKIDSAFKPPFVSKNLRYAKGIDTVGVMICATEDTSFYIIRPGKAYKMFSQKDTNSEIATQNYVRTTVNQFINDSAVKVTELGFGLTRVDSILIVDSANILTVSSANRYWLKYIGATDSLLLGEYPIRAGQFMLDLTPTMPSVKGGMYWDTTNICPAMPFDATYTHRFGQALVERGRNNTGSAISAGKVVYISGAQGNNPTITMANPDSVNSSRVIGITVESIADNATGYVMVTGKFDGINTSGFTVGAALYLDTITGGLTQTLLPSPHNVVYVGQALNSTNNGRIFIRPAMALGSDTTLGNASEQISPTQQAVKKYVTNNRTTLSAGTGISITGSVPTYTVTNSAPDRTVSLTGAGTVSVTGTYPTFTVTGTGGAGGVTSITSTGSTMQVTGTTTVNVEVDTTHSFTFTGTNTFTRDITVDSASIGTGNGLSANIRFGRSALPSATTGTGLVALGENTLNKIITGISDVAIGRNAMANTSTSVNGIVAVGIAACNYSTGDNNTAIGTSCMSRSVAWNGIANTGVGANSGNATTTASSNSWLGAGAANALTSGSSNTLLGVNSGSAITTGGSNVILGSYTGNAGGLDIRTLSNRLVLSDGAGNIRAYHTGTNWLIGTVTNGSTGVLQLGGSLGLNTAGNKINISTGTNASVGTGTLSAGSATISTTAVTASSIIQVQLTSCSSCGTLYISTVTAGTSFVVTSTNGSDASTFNYWIIN